MPPHPGASSRAVGNRMSTQARTSTAPEVSLRRELFTRGLRYRVAYRVPGLPRRSIDIAFPGKRVAVFVDGCFWHGCPAHGNAPTTNAEWWRQKLATNQARDEDTTRRLRDLGWQVVRVWEHDCPDAAAAVVVQALAE